MSEEPRYIIALVHGTFARNSQWAKKDSPLGRALVDKLPGPIEFITKKWTGHNRQSAREAAAEELRSELSKSCGEHPKAQAFVIAHSHGGNVALYALKDQKLQSKVTGVVCINTPFVAALRRNTYFLTLALSIGLALGYLSVVVLSYAWFPTVDATLPLRSDAGLHTQAVLWFFGDGWGPTALRCFLLIVTADLGIRIWRNRVTHDEMFQEKREKAIARIELPTISKSKVFCVWSAGDEVVGAFSLLEGLANLPYILLHPLVFAVAIVFIAYDVWGGGLGGGCHVPGWLLADAPLRWPAPNPLLQAVASIGCELGAIIAGYAIILAYLTMFSNTVLRLLPVGINLRDFARTFFVKIIFTPTPVTAQHVEFLDVALPPQLLAHSAAYDNEITIERIIDWIKRQSRASAISG